jgi:hypothetical protein
LTPNSPQPSPELTSRTKTAIQAGDNSEVARVKQDVGAALADHRVLTEEYKRLKAQRPDWKTPQRAS